MFVYIFADFCNRLFWPLLECIRNTISLTIKKVYNEISSICLKNFFITSLLFLRQPLDILQFTNLTHALYFSIFRDYFLLYRMSYIWYTALAVITVLFVGTIVSLITGAFQGFEICMSR